jgi:hypothetical protein
MRIAIGTRYGWGHAKARAKQYDRELAMVKIGTQMRIHKAESAQENEASSLRSERRQALDRGTMGIGKYCPELIPVAQASYIPVAARVVARVGGAIYGNLREVEREYMNLLCKCAHSRRVAQRVC